MILLLGTISNGPNSVAVFGLGDSTVVKKKGETVAYFGVGTIERTGVMLRYAKRIYLVRPGDQVDGGDLLPITITTGVETRGNTLRLTSSLREYVTKDGLMAVLMQAASAPERRHGEQIGYRIYEIDAGSIFDLTGLKNNDVVTHIDDVGLTDPVTAMKALMAIKVADKFSFRFIRSGVIEHRTVEVW